MDDLKLTPEEICRIICPNSTDKYNTECRGSRPCPKYNYVEKGNAILLQKLRARGNMYIMKPNNKYYCDDFIPLSEYIKEVTNAVQK